MNKNQNCPDSSEAFKSLNATKEQQSDITHCYFKWSRNKGESIWVIWRDQYNATSGRAPDHIWPFIKSQ